MKPSDTTAILSRLSGLWARQPISRETVEEYTRALAAFDFPTISHAIDRLTRTAKFFPAIAEILEAAAMARIDAPSSSKAWGEVVSEIRRVGHCNPPVFSCEPIHEAVREIGGWLHLCNSQNATADRSKFHDAYRQLIRDAVHEFARRDLPALPPSEMRGQIEQ